MMAVIAAPKPWPQNRLQRNIARFASVWIPKENRRARRQPRATRQKTSVVLAQKNTKGTRTATTRTTTAVATTMVAIAAPKPWWGGKWARNTARFASAWIPQQSQRRRHQRRRHQRRRHQRATRQK